MVSVEIMIRRLPQKLKNDWESGKFSFIDFLSNELKIPQEDIEAGYGEEYYVKKSKLRKVV